MSGNKSLSDAPGLTLTIDCSPKASVTTVEVSKVPKSFLIEIPSLVINSVPLEPKPPKSLLIEIPSLVIKSVPLGIASVVYFVKSILLVIESF